MNLQTSEKISGRHLLTKPWLKSFKEQNILLTFNSEETCQDLILLLRFLLHKWKSMTKTNRSKWLRSNIRLSRITSASSLCWDKALFQQPWKVWKKRIWSESCKRCQKVPHCSKSIKKPFVNAREVWTQTRSPVSITFVSHQWKLSIRHSSTENTLFWLCRMSSLLSILS